MRFTELGDRQPLLNPKQDIVGPEAEALWMEPVEAVKRLLEKGKENPAKTTESDPHLQPHFWAVRDKAIADMDAENKVLLDSLVELIEAAEVEDAREQKYMEHAALLTYAVIKEELRGSPMPDVSAELIEDTLNWVRRPMGRGELKQHAHRVLAQSNNGDLDILLWESFLNTGVPDSQVMYGLRKGCRLMHYLLFEQARRDREG